MNSRNIALATGFIVSLILTTFCFGWTKELTGRVFAYDPMVHILKLASFVENQEIVLLQIDSGRHGKRYIKLVVHGFSQTQIPDNYFTGDSILTMRATRDRNCDQKTVDFVTSVVDDEHPKARPDGTKEVPLNGGKFIISQHFKGQPLPQLSNLECYSTRSRAEH
jgi:hypothetical protein